MIDIQSYYGKSHQGPHLNLNEDDIYINLENRIFNVLDGLGGSNIGDQAVDLVKGKIDDFFSKVSADPDATMPYFYNPKYLLETNVLVNSIFLAHSALCDLNEKRAMSDRGAVAGLFTILSENILSIISIGNCCAYLYRNGQVSLLSAPDCVVPVGSYQQNIEHRTFPLQAMGLYDDLSPKIWEHNVHKDDIILLLTDGIYGHLG